jgi:hypothetical protein
MTNSAALFDEDPQIGAFTTDAQKTRIAALHARFQAHHKAVKEAESDEKIKNEPELVEYAARWRAFGTELNELGERANATLSWITDAELDQDDAKLNVLLEEWKSVANHIAIRKNNGTIAVLENEVRLRTDPTYGLKAHTRLPDSPATPAPDHPPPKNSEDEADSNTGLKIGLVGTIAAATVISAASSGSAGARAGFAVAGSALTIIAGVLLFGGDSASDIKDRAVAEYKKKAEKKSSSGSEKKT